MRPWPLLHILLWGPGKSSWSYQLWILFQGAVGWELMLEIVDQIIAQGVVASSVQTSSGPELAERAFVVFGWENGCPEVIRVGMEPAKSPLVVFGMAGMTVTKHSATDIAVAIGSRLAAVVEANIAVVPLHRDCCSHFVEDMELGVVEIEDMLRWMVWIDHKYLSAGRGMAAVEQGNRSRGPIERYIRNYWGLGKVALAEDSQSYIVLRLGAAAMTIVVDVHRRWCPLRRIQPRVRGFLGHLNWQSQLCYECQRLDLLV
jgi:hypothetical protein